MNFDNNQNKQTSSSTKVWKLSKYCEITTCISHMFLILIIWYHCVFLGQKCFEKGRHCWRHCCSVGELKITFASTCKESVFNVLFNVLFLVLDFPLGAPNTLLKHVIERSIWRIVVGEGSWWGWGFSQDWWLGFWSCWNLSLTAVFWIDFSVACFERV